MSTIDGLTEQVIGCAMEVHRTIGPGLLESIYRDCLLFELNAAHLAADAGRRLPVVYKGKRIRSPLVVDLLVEESLVVELKAVDRLHPIHQAQLITYLKLSGCSVGLLMNFNAPTLRAGLKRVVHPDLYRAGRVPAVSTVVDACTAAGPAAEPRISSCSSCLEAPGPPDLLCLL